MVNKREQVIGYLKNNTDELHSLVSEMNSYNGALEHLDVQENNEEFFEVYFTGNPMEAVRATQYGDYNYNHDYVSFDGYGNLVSYSQYEYDELLEDNIDEIADQLMEEHYHLNLSYDLEEIFEEEDEEEEEEEEEDEE